MDACDLDQAVVVAIGGNLPGAQGPVQAVLEAAVARLPSEGLRVRRLSRWWRSSAWPDPADPPFLNAVALIETDLEPAEALQALHRIEAAFGRRRTVANAPRPLDLDLIAFRRQTSLRPGLVLPHPRAHERLFVMGPLAEIAPDWIHPGLGLSAAHLSRHATVGTDAQPGQA